MSYKDPERRKQHHARYMKEVWYPKNKDKHMAFVRRNNQRVTAFIQEYKRDRACMDCGFSGKDFPYVLDFDHLDGGVSKKFTIGSWSQSVLSIEAIVREIEKCELVCANCHRIRTFSKKTQRR